jgi:hypothetical protein
MLMQPTPARGSGVGPYASAELDHRLPKPSAKTMIRPAGASPMTPGRTLNRIGVAGRATLRSISIAGECQRFRITLFTRTLRGDQSGNKPYKK